MPKKILLGLLTAGAVGGVTMLATNAFFSDTETSTGNILQAGAIDLLVDNTSYYNGVFNPNTSWLQPRNLTEELFFDFRDLKPGDYGEDTISLHVNNNDSWLCADVQLASDDDNGLTEPESEDGDTTSGAGQGELADAVKFIWWADDGDNVLEVGETPLPSGPLGVLSVGQVATVTLADSGNNLWGSGPFPGGQTRFIGKAWCFGDLVLTPVAQDGFGQVGTPGGQGSNGPDFRTAGFTCNGVAVNNITQTDSYTANIRFRAVQSRNNPGFLCSQGVPPFTF